MVGALWEIITRVARSLTAPPGWSTIAALAVSPRRAPRFTPAGERRLVPSDQTNTYRAEVWRAVAALWNGFGEEPEPLITEHFPDVPLFIEQMSRERVGPEAAAVQVVALVVTRYVEQSMTAEQKQVILDELKKILGMGFEEAQGYMAHPFVKNAVEAWKLSREWSAAGRIDQDAGKFLLGKIVRALASSS